MVTLGSNIGSAAHPLVVQLISCLGSESVAGDHGEDGIQTFVDQHKWDQRFKQLWLEQLVQLEIDD